MRLLPVILIGCLFGLFIFMAILYTLYRLRYVRERQRRHQASLLESGQPASKLIIRKGQVVDISQMSRPPSIISRHSSARNHMSVYSKLSYGIRNRTNSPGGSPRYWPVSVYSTHSHTYPHWSQRRSTLSAHQPPLPSSCVEAQIKGQWGERRETPLCGTEGPSHPMYDSITRSRSNRRRESSFTGNTATPAQSLQRISGGTVTSSVEVDVMLNTPAKSSLNSKATPPSSLDDSSRPVVKPYVGSSSTNCFGFVPVPYTTSPRSLRAHYKGRHHRPSGSLSSMMTFDSDISDAYTIGHATPVMLPADPRTSPLAGASTFNRPLSKYSVPVEERYVKALPSLPPISHTPERIEVNGS